LASAGVVHTLRGMKHASACLAVTLFLVPALVAAQRSPSPTRLRVVSGFGVPESARYDADRDLYYISNVTGHPMAEDNDGFISVMNPDGDIVALRFIAGGVGGVTLHAPKGMALVGDTLWVTDITRVRGFHRETGRPVADVDLAPAGASFLNDITVSTDGSMYISDTGFRLDSLRRMRHPGPDRVYRIERPSTVTVAVEGDTLRAPNGVFWDRADDRLLIGAFMGRSVLSWHPQRGLSHVASGPGGYDGIERVPGLGVVLASQDGRAVVLLQGDRLVPIIEGVEDMGDLGVDTRRRRLAIPRLDTNLLEIWQLPPPA
jgi:sugar lactone lactonase YvrE